MPVGPKVSDVLRSGVSVQVDLLTEFPDSSDPTTWVKPIYHSYRTANVIPTPNNSIQDALSGLLEAVFDAPAVQFPPVVAFGVTHNGSCLFFGRMADYSVGADDQNKVVIKWLCQPWEGS